MKMKKIAVIAVVAVLLCALGVSVAAYDSSEDPIISLSYLTDIFKAQILTEVDKRVETEVNAKLAGYTPSTQSDSATDGSTASSASSEFVVVELTTGDELYAAGACDIMLRAGTAICTAPDLKQGIADYTDATEIYAGESLVKNHMCLIPRGDGRGVIATSESVFIMVRGNYTVVKH